MKITDTCFTVEFDKDDQKAIERVYTIVDDIMGKCNELTCCDNISKFSEDMENINTLEKLLLKLLDEEFIKIHL